MFVLHLKDKFIYGLKFVNKGKLFSSDNKQFLFNAIIEEKPFSYR